MAFGIQSVEKWDEASSDYQQVFKLGQNDYNRAIFSFWQEHGMVQPGDRVLDVGCGVGKYGVMFARLGCDVTLTDISGGMLKLAAQNMAEFTTPWTVYQCDFNTASGEEPEFAKGFDFSISTMSPAIHDVETVKKLSRMTRRCCFITRFCSWAQPDRDALMASLGVTAKPRMTDIKEDCENVYNAVLAAGYKPEVLLVDYNWCDTRTAADQADYMRRNYSEALCGVEEASILTAAEKLCTADGMFTDRVNTKVAWIYWKTGEDNNG